MIAVRSLITVLRTRASRGPLYMLWPALLVSGLVYAHGASVVSAAHHLPDNGFSSVATSRHGPVDPAGASRGITPFLDEADEADEAHDGERASHSSQECMPVQPQQGAALQAPCPGTLGEITLGSQVPRHSAAAVGRATGAFLSSARATGILRI
ncbi:hypothetical protein ACFUEM_08220 [Streptomyces anulatus]|uniref:hypothetical protein n=1 Tax=Streptomyces anulatus TaxID=1892 RepID=UPI0035DCA77F